MTFRRVFLYSILVLSGDTLYAKNAFLAWCKKKFMPSVRFIDLQELDRTRKVQGKARQFNQVVNQLNLSYKERTCLSDMLAMVAFLADENPHNLILTKVMGGTSIYDQLFPVVTQKKIPFLLRKKQNNTISKEKIVRALDSISWLMGEPEGKLYTGPAATKFKNKLDKRASMIMNNPDLSPEQKEKAMAPLQGLFQQVHFTGCLPLFKPWLKESVQFFQECSESLLSFSYDVDPQEAELRKKHLEEMKKDNEQWSYYSKITPVRKKIKGALCALQAVRDRFGVKREDYELLDLQTNDVLTTDIISKNYKSKIRSVHPDKNLGDNGEVAQKLNNAKDNLLRALELERKVGIGKSNQDYKNLGQFLRCLESSHNRLKQDLNFINTPLKTNVVELSSGTYPFAYAGVGKFFCDVLKKAEKNPEILRLEGNR